MTLTVVFRIELASASFCFKFTLTHRLNIKHIPFLGMFNFNFLSYIDSASLIISFVSLYTFHFLFVHKLHSSLSLGQLWFNFGSSILFDCIKVNLTPASASFPFGRNIIIHYVINTHHLPIDWLDSEDGIETWVLTH